MSINSKLGVLIRYVRNTTAKKAVESKKYTNPANIVNFFVITLFVETKRCKTFSWYICHMIPFLFLMTSNGSRLTRPVSSS